MKKLKILTTGILAASVLAAPLSGLAADQKPEKKPKPYTLKTCIVSGEKLGEMGKPAVYVYEDREVKFCCKDCIPDFQKDPEKYVKNMK